MAQISRSWRQIIIWHQNIGSTCLYQSVCAFLGNIQNGPVCIVRSIPFAGFGTHEFPQTIYCLKYYFLLVDTDGLLKLALMIMMSRLLDVGIEGISLIFGENEQEDFDCLLLLFRMKCKKRCWMISGSARNSSIPCIRM